MAKQDSSIKTFSTRNVSTKQFKLYLATAKTPAERKAIKNLYLSEPLKFYGKQAVEDDTLQTDLPKAK